MRRLVISACFIAAFASQACGNVVAATPVAGMESANPSARGSEGGACAITLSTAVKGYPHNTVAVAEVTGCDPADVAWTLVSDPNGVVYRIYPNHDALLADQPSSSGHGPYLRLVDFIASNPVCVQAAVSTATARIGLLGATCPR